MLSDDIRIYNSFISLLQPNRPHRIAFHEKGLGVSLALLDFENYGGKMLFLQARTIVSKTLQQGIRLFIQAPKEGFAKLVTVKFRLKSVPSIAISE